MNFPSMRNLRIAVILAVTIALAAPAFGQSATNSGLRFPVGGRFKIVQFTDIHYGQKKDVQAERQVREDMAAILDMEKPDLVALTGDIVTVVDGRDPRPVWPELLAPIISRSIPWFAVMGNHDDEWNRGIGRDQIMASLERMPYSLAKAGPAELGGGGNFVLPIRGTNGIAAALYALDSRAYPNKAAHGRFEEYDWISFDQIGWYRKQSAAMTAANGGKPLPALAFFHIPVPEFAEGDTTHVGHWDDSISSPKVNSGLLCSMAECGDVMGVFVGHDHLNDASFIFSRKLICQEGIYLAYGRKTGNVLAAYGRPLASGARVIELIEGRRHFESWIRTADGRIEFKTEYPATPAKP